MADLTTWSWTGEPIDLLWASPPCEEFAREWMPWSKTGKAPSMDLVNAVYRLVEEIQPRWWIIENVKGANRGSARPGGCGIRSICGGIFPQLTSSA